jgi:hypothetical protein
LVVGFPFFAGSVMRSCLKIVLAVFVFAAISSVSFAEQQYGKLSAYMRTPVPYYVGNPKTYSPKAYSYTRTVGNAFTKSVPRAYPYGYFGAQTRPYSTQSAGYYNDYTQSSSGRGY